MTREMEPYISICIPSYRRKSIVESIRSITTQKNWGCYIKEILIGDDYPDSAEIKKTIFKLQKDNDKIRYFQNIKNIGLDANFIKLMHLANGKYILFITDDDQFVEGSLALIDKTLSANPRVGVIGGGRLIKVGRKIIRYESLFESRMYDKSSDSSILGELVFESNVLSGLCLRKEIISYKNIENYFGALFAHLIIIARNANKSGYYYLNNPLVYHTISNKVFWTYKEDYNLVDMLRVGEEISSSSIEISKSYTSHVLMTVAYVTYTNIINPVKVIKLVISLNKYGVSYLMIITSLFKGIYKMLYHKIKYYLNFQKLIEKSCI